MTTQDTPRLATVELGSRALAQGDLLDVQPSGQATLATGPTRRVTGPLVPSLRGPSPT